MLGIIKWLEPIKVQHNSQVTIRYVMPEEQSVFIWIFKIFPNSSVIYIGQFVIVIRPSCPFPTRFLKSFLIVQSLQLAFNINDRKNKGRSIYYSLICWYLLYNNSTTWRSIVGHRVIWKVLK